MIKKYSNFKRIDEKISFEDFCSKTQQIKKMIVDQNKEIIENSQHIMYDILDIIGHHIPGLFSITYKSSINVNGYVPGLSLDAEAEKEYRGTDFEEDDDDDWLKNFIKRIKKGNEIILCINYQHASLQNNFKALETTDELLKVNDDVKESLKSIGVEFKIQHLTPQSSRIYRYELFIPIELKLSDSIDDFDVDQNQLKSFKEFIKKYNIPNEGEIELSNIIRSLI